MNNPANVQGASCLYAQITRANGKQERRRLVGYFHPNPLRQAFVRLLMKIGAL